MLGIVIGYTSPMKIVTIVKHTSDILRWNYLLTIRKTKILR